MQNTAKNISWKCFSDIYKLIINVTKAFSTYIFRCILHIKQLFEEINVKCSIINSKKSGIKVEIYAKINQNHPEIVKLTPKQKFWENICLEK